MTMSASVILIKCTLSGVLKTAELHLEILKKINEGYSKFLVGCAA